MHKFNYFCSVVLIFTLSLMIVILSSNLVLRASTIYTYHFNDSQVMNQIPYSVTGSQMADDIASYLSSFSGKDFQVYEDNGIYRDPVFTAEEQQAMGKARNILNIELAIGLLCLALTLAIYIYLWKIGFKEALLNRYRVSVAVTLVLLIGQGVGWATKAFRSWAYDFFIGVDLGKDSTLEIILGDPFYKTYILFASILGAILLSVLTYINYHLTKPARIFY